MASSRVEVGNPGYKIVRDYVEVLKPRETSLLTFIGVCAAIIAELMCRFPLAGTARLVIFRYVLLSQPLG